MSGEGSTPQAIRKLAPGKLVIASHNKGKVREIADLLAGRGFEVVSAAELDLPEPVETGTTFFANAELKARSAADLSGYPALADDSGLCVDALNGDPGVYTADWAETPDGRDWNLAMRKVEDALAAKGPDASRGAHFVSVLPTAMSNGSRAVPRARSSGRRVAGSALAMIRCSSRTAMTRPMRNSRMKQRTRSATAPKRSNC